MRTREWRRRGRGAIVGAGGIRAACRAEQEVGTTAALRLATFNVLHGRSPSDDRVDLDRFARAVASLDADVLALQEVDRGQDRSGGADLTAVAAEAGGLPFHRFAATLHGAPGAWSAATGRERPGAPAYGVALLSRHPVRAWQVLRLPVLHGRVPVRSGGSAPARWVHDEPRVALVAELDGAAGVEGVGGGAGARGAAGAALTVIATHLSLVPWWARRQVSLVERRTRERPDPRVLLGDLNLPGAVPSQASGLLPLVAAPTFPAHRPDRQIDHVLATPGLRVVGEGRAVDLGLSDHRALVVDVEVGG